MVQIARIDRRAEWVLAILGSPSGEIGCFHPSWTFPALAGPVAAGRDRRVGGILSAIRRAGKSAWRDVARTGIMS
jgi:hypothetical protein